MPLPSRGENIGGRKPSPKSKSSHIRTPFCPENWGLRTTELFGQDRLNVLWLNGANGRSAENVLFPRFGIFFHRSCEEMHELLFPCVMRNLDD
jgi:hypothetical protein